VPPGNFFRLLIFVQGAVWADCCEPQILRRPSYVSDAASPRFYAERCTGRMLRAADKFP